MKVVKNLTVSQLAQRADEIQEILDILVGEYDAREILINRFEEIRKELEKKIKENTFNKGVVSPLPPDHVDPANPYVVTPKAPTQVEREYNDWEKSLDA